MNLTPQDGDVAYFTGCVDGGDPYRVTVSYRHATKGWHNIASGLRLDDDHPGLANLHLLVRDHHSVTELAGANENTDLTLCPRCSGLWGEDSTCQMCVDEQDEPRDRSLLARVDFEVWFRSDPDAADSVDALAMEIAESDGVVNTNYTLTNSSQTGRMGV
ncbi:hypothetical protein [Tessaracoccus sp.]